MSFLVMADNNVNIKASQDGAMYAVFAGGLDFIIADIGDEFEITHQADSLQVTIGQGEAVIGGRHITANEDNQITLPASSSVYLCLRIDLSQTAGSEGSLVALQQAQMQEGNLNGGDNVRDLLLYVVNTNTSGVSSVTDYRTITSASSGTTYKNMNLTISEFQNYTSTAPDLRFYADVAVLEARTKQIAIPVADLEVMRKSDSDKLAQTNTIENGKVRLYFTNKPTQYVLKALILTMTREVS